MTGFQDPLKETLAQRLCIAFYFNDLTSWNTANDVEKEQWRQVVRALNGKLKDVYTETNDRTK